MKFGRGLVVIACLSGLAVGAVRLRQRAAQERHAVVRLAAEARRLERESARQRMIWAGLVDPRQIRRRGGRMSLMLVGPGANERIAPREAVASGDR